MNRNTRSGVERSKRGERLSTALQTAMYSFTTRPGAVEHLRRNDETACPIIHRLSRSDGQKIEFHPPAFKHLQEGILLRSMWQKNRAESPTTDPGRLFKFVHGASDQVALTLHEQPELSDCFRSTAAE